MKITKIYVKPLAEPSARLCGTASIILDNVFAINDIKIIRLEDRFGIAFPKADHAKKRGQETMAPLNRETREYIENEILKQFFITDKIENNRVYNVWKGN